MFRSETMHYYKLLFVRESSWEILDELGRLGTVQLEDLNSNDLSNQRPYYSQLKDAQARLEKLELIEAILVERNLLPSKESFDPQKNKTVLNSLASSVHQESTSKYFNDIYDRIDDRYNRIKEHVDHLESIRSTLEKLEDRVSVLEVLQSHLPEKFSQSVEPSINDLVKLEYLSGIIGNADLFNFQKSLFRITRGNTYAAYEGVGRGKSAVFIALPRTASNQLREKIERLGNALNFRQVAIPQNFGELNESLEKARIDLKETTQVYENSENALKNTLFSFSSEETTDNSELKSISLVYELKTSLLKHICLLEKMNCLGQKGDFLIANFWLPDGQENKLAKSLNRLSGNQSFDGFLLEKIDHEVAGHKPPTKFKTQGFFEPFQDIVDTYGVPRYKEVNPGLFTAVTFPFLFGVMFGDIGHGLVLFIFGLLLIFKSNWFPRELVRVKYLIALMGFFAFYCGFVYNDFVSVPMVIQPSCYSTDKKGTVYRQKDCVYSFGIDYAWHESSNSIAFVNSYKMKTSIIYGVSHMLLGIFLKGVNCVYFNSVADFFLEFIPQILFMTCTFGYMVVCIIIKWLTDYTKNPQKAPSIIALFINLVTSVDQPLFHTAEDQLNIQRVLAAIAVACVPIMLLGKPIVNSVTKRPSPHPATDHTKLSKPSKDTLRKEGNTDNGGQGDASDHENALSDKDNKVFYNSEEEENETLLKENTHDKNVDEHAEELGEQIIHQSIETIEFVLGSISNTASYLRLWALSLAHSQLAKVFLDMLLKPYFSGEYSIMVGTLATIVMFVAFVAVSTGVLMFMDSMECFLHTLRLHWVEFQNKFFKGDGYRFEPFSFIDFIDSRF